MRFATLKRFAICAAMALAAAVLVPEDAQAGLFGRRGGGGCSTGCSSGCGSGGCNTGSQGCNISQNTQPARAADLIQQPVQPTLPPPANATTAIVPSAFKTQAKAYSSESLLAFARPVDSPAPGKAVRYVAAKPKPSGNVLASK